MIVFPSRSRPRPGRGRLFLDRKKGGRSAAAPANLSLRSFEEDNVSGSHATFFHIDGFRSCLRRLRLGGNRRWLLGAQEWRQPIGFSEKLLGGLRHGLLLHPRDPFRRLVAHGRNAQKAP